MAPTVRESDCKAAPATIWKACFEHMKWEAWDPDVTVVEDVSGPCQDGTTLVFVMKEGPIKKIPCNLSDVKENESVRFSGAVAMGLMKFDGFVEISTKDEKTSTIKYTFNMGGPVGALLMAVNPKPAVSGTEGGLANMVKLSEEAQK